MESVSAFLENFDLTQLLDLLIQVVAALLCVSFHEMGHGYAAWLLGDSTAKTRGRVSMNPLRHIDPLGLLLLITAGFGWAKPVPVDMRHFRRPKLGMALTALAGPVSNFLMGFVALAIASALYHFALPQLMTTWLYYLFLLLIRVAILSVGLGLFNLIPIPPLDGSKVMFSLLPDHIYYTILRYERYLMVLLFALVFLNLLDTPLSILLDGGLRGLCRLTGFPMDVIGL